MSNNLFQKSLARLHKSWRRDVLMRRFGRSCLYPLAPNTLIWWQDRFQKGTLENLGNHLAKLEEQSCIYYFRFLFAVFTNFSKFTKLDPLLAKSESWNIFLFSLVHVNIFLVGQINILRKRKRELRSPFYRKVLVRTGLKFLNQS